MYGIVLIRSGRCRSAVEGYGTILAWPRSGSGKHDLGEEEMVQQMVAVGKMHARREARQRREARLLEEELVRDDPRNLRL